MSNEILNSIEWYLVKMEVAIDNTLITPPPADLKNLRLNYGLYIESIFSLIDFLKDYHFDIIPDLQVRLEQEGDNTYNYFRELRNAVVHRGFDLSTKGQVIDGNTRITTPDRVKNRNGKLVENPREKVLLKALLSFDLAVRDVIYSRIKSVGLLDKKAINEVAMKSAIIDGILFADIPPHFKKMLSENYDSYFSPDFFSIMQDDLLLRIESLLSLQRIYKRINII